LGNKSKQDYDFDEFEFIIPSKPFYAGTKPLFGGDRAFFSDKAETKQIAGSHAYQVIPKQDGTFDVINPWNRAIKTNITEREFKLYFEKSNMFTTDYK